MTTKPKPSLQAAIPISAAFPIQSAVTFTGILPCANCDRRNITLNLRPDGTFLLRLTYIGLKNGRDITFIDLGRWAISANQKRLTLHGGTSDPHELAITHADTLRILDPEGQEIDDCTNCSLARRTWVDPFVQPFQLWGLYVYEESGLFTEQYTGRQFHVAARGDSRSLEHAYRQVAGQSGRPLFATVLGHFEMAVDELGVAKEVLVVDRFEGLLIETGQQQPASQEAGFVEGAQVVGRLPRSTPRP